MWSYFLGKNVTMGRNVTVILPQVIKSLLHLVLVLTGTFSPLLTTKP